MLRRPANSISLTPTDISWHLTRCKHENVGQGRSFTAGVYDRPLLECREYKEEENGEISLAVHAEEVATVDDDDSIIRGESIPVDFYQLSSRDIGSSSLIEITGHLSSNHPSLQENHEAESQARIEEDVNDSSVISAQSQLGHRPTSSPYTQGQLPPSHPPHHLFDFGGFIENIPRDSSPFAPEEVFNVLDISSWDQQTRLAREELPRSPLFQPDVVLNSAQSHYASTVSPGPASSRSPGLWLSQPARRPKVYRPRALRYSFEESERSSAAYEDIQISDNDSTPGDGNSASKLCFRDGHNNSLESSNFGADVPTFPLSSKDCQKSSEDTSEGPESFSFSRLTQLPTPFSATPRRMSEAIVITPQSSEQAQSSADAVDISVLGFERLELVPEATSASRGEMEGGHDSANSNDTMQSLSNPPSSVVFESATLGLLVSSSTLPSYAVPRNESLPYSLSSPPSTPYRLRIYNDRVPASLQPQTPQNLPEDRHRSRYHPSYTAPVDRRVGIDWRGGRGRQRRRRGARSDSPSGIDWPGFQGLYGGQENAADDVLFDRASRRLWVLQEARRSGRSTTDTPDRELFFGDDRGDYR